MWSQYHRRARRLPGPSLSHRGRLSGGQAECHSDNTDSWLYCFRTRPVVTIPPLAVARVTGSAGLQRSRATANDSDREMNRIAIHFVLLCQLCMCDLGDILGFSSDIVFPSYANLGLHKLEVSEWIATFTNL